MSYAERKYKARSKQGRLLAGEWAQLKSDLLALLDGKNHPKETGALMEQLVKNCGWDYHKIWGPRQFVRDALESLESDGLIESRHEGWIGPDPDDPEFGVTSWYWRK